jgi:ABC-type transport system involved in multi-copper enzyme maturation permease subunit
MNTHTARALLQDAFYQVLDNKVFRLLVILAICLIAPTFLVAFKADEVSILFGWKVIPYSSLVMFSGGANPSGPNAQMHVIQGLQSMFVEGLAGNIGIMLSLAATAFFVPRMLEKGEADTLFSKPVGRFVLLMARYSAGVLFVGVLAFGLILGMHVGLLVRSGYSDPGFLWGALTLVYVFALIHAFSTAVGVFTRSSVAALLLSILLFWCNGCVQKGWVLKEYGAEYQRIQREAHEEDATPDDGFDNPALKTLFLVLDGLHFTLPKTHDADVLTKKFRQAVSGDGFVLVDTAGKLAIEGNPKGFERQDGTREVDLAAHPATWTARVDGREVGRLTISRRDRTIEKRSGDKVRKVRTSSATAANELVKMLEARSDTEGKPSRERTDERPVRDRVTWKERRDGKTVAHDRAFLAIDEWMYEVDLEGDPGGLELEQNSGMPTQESLALSQFLRGLKPQRDAASDLRPDEWYEKRFGWSSQLKFNAFFSLTSSIAFALALLLLARWRLSRIDF